MNALPKVPATPSDLVREARTPLASCDRRTLTLRYANPSFVTLFGGASGQALSETIPGFDVAAALSALRTGQGYEFACDGRDGNMTQPFAMTLRLCADGDQAMLEGHDLSRQKEAEYMLDSYARMAERHARELRREKERAEKLLLNVMPRSIYEEIRELGSVSPQRFDDASVLMLDFVGFTQMAVTRDPKAIVAELNEIFTAFDRIVELFDCERIKTSGDGYMAVAGVPEARADHVANLAKAALRMRRYLVKRNGADSQPWLFRAGIATGQLIGSIVGIHKYVYDVFGPAANLAARLEAQAQPMQIVLCERTRTLLAGEFALTALAPVELKGFGRQSLHVLNEELASIGIGGK